MTKERKYSPGKIDYNNSGRKNCKVEISWSFDGYKFSMSGTIWNPRQTDCYSGGQNLEEIAALFPDDKTVQSMVAVWREYHLNDTAAGSPAQRTWLEKHLPEGRDYAAACKALADAGLNPDPSYIHEGKPYVYGSAWLKREIPEEIAAIIRGWCETSKVGVTADPFTVWIDRLFKYTVEHVDDAGERDNWHCTFQRKDAPQIKEVFDYHTGYGHRKDTMGRPFKMINRNNHMGMSYAFSPKKSAPLAVNVLDCLQMDAAAYSNNRDFLDFAAEFGYEDAKEARRVWQACEVTYTQLQKLFGRHFSTFMDSEIEAA